MPAAVYFAYYAGIMLDALGYYAENYAGIISLGLFTCSGSVTKSLLVLPRMFKNS